MKSIVSIVTVLTILLCGCTAKESRTTSSRPELPALVARVQQSVVTVVTYDVDDEFRGIGSGFFTDPSGRLITSHHVLRGAYRAEVKTHDGEVYPISRVLAADSARDLIRVQVDLPAGEVPWVAVTRRQPRIAEGVVVVGSPLGLEQTVSEGIVSAVRELPSVGKIFQLSAPISPGSSGSPVVDMAGRVVGVVSFQTAAGQNLNFAIAGQGVLNLLVLETPLSLAEWTVEAAPNPSGLASELCRKGFKFSLEGEYQEALRYYRQATEKSPDNSEAWYGLGGCYAGLEQPQKALAAFREPLRLNPDDIRAHLNLARFYTMLGRRAEALASYREVIRIEPRHAPALFNMAMIHVSSGQLQQGAAAFHQVLRIESDHVPTLFNLGLTYAKLEQYEEALAYFDRVATLDPDDAAVQYYRGRVFYRMQSPQAEMQAYLRAIRLDPEHVLAHYHLGLAFIRQARRPEALGQYKILKGLDPERAEQLFEALYSGEKQP